MVSQRAQSISPYSADETPGHWMNQGDTSETTWWHVLPFSEGDAGSDTGMMLTWKESTVSVFNLFLKIFSSFYILCSDQGVFPFPNHGPQTFFPACKSFPVCKSRSLHSLCSEPCVHKLTPFQHIFKICILNLASSS